MFNIFKKRELLAKEEANRLEEERIKLEKKKLSAQHKMISIISQREKAKAQKREYKAPEIIGGVIPNGEKPAIAQDSSFQNTMAFVDGSPQFYNGFCGYQELVALSQSTDYRCVFETASSEMTREWGAVKSSDDLNNKLKAKIKAIEERFKELDIKNLVRKHIETELIFGRSQIFIDVKGQDNVLDVPLTITKAGIQKGKLNGFRLIEPLWSTPCSYNASNPLADDFYSPEEWYIMGKRVHANRLLTLICRPVPDLLKPAYNFSGVSMIQLMQPYVERWQRTVDSVSELIHSFSLTGIKTDMQNILMDGGSDFELIKRAELFSILKDNQKVMLVDKEGEEFFQFNTPLSTLDALLQKSQEQMAAPSHIPLVKLTGITPSGLNASSEGEIQVFYDYISAQQESHLLPQIKKILDIVQLDLFGEIDQSLFFKFNPLYQMTDEQLANIEKTKADTDAVYIMNGVISQEESRGRLARDEDGDYSGIDESDVPEDNETLEAALNGNKEETGNTERHQA